MPRFITHEPLAQNLFNISHNTGGGPLQPWSRVLTNTEPLVRMLVARMEHDYVASAPKMRKPWGKEVESGTQTWFILLIETANT